MRTPRQVARPWATTKPEILDAWVEIHDRDDKIIRAGRIYATVRYVDPDQPITEWNAAPFNILTHGLSLAVTFEGDTEETVVEAHLKETLHLRLPVPSKYPKPMQFGVLRVQG